uniref:Uncharacterized protein n=1 Tax=Romanomermis culicivorax TaxID=13658 RepID=A0A915HFG0_ROMCU
MSTTKKKTALTKKPSKTLLPREKTPSTATSGNTRKTSPNSKLSQKNLSKSGNSEVDESSKLSLPNKDLSADRIPDPMTKIEKVEDAALDCKASVSKNESSSIETIPDSTTNSNESPTTSADEPECKKRRRWCAKKMAKLEQQFSQIKEALYHERMQLVESQLNQVKEETNDEYKRRLDVIEENYLKTSEMNDKLYKFQLNEAKIIYESEKFCAQRDYENRLRLLCDRIEEDINDKIKKLENDKHSADVEFELWQREQKWDKIHENGHKKEEIKEDSPSESIKFNWKKSAKKNGGDKKKKPVLVSGPYVIYNLLPQEIEQDYMCIQRAIIEADLRRNVY